ncbi:hypothetical protein [Candidatus Uabimicrobium sp. HlEnr_7]|uniref:hypothetical protein n=1 Tax=Candidatus Uabimicrobium helgolandensis TaxID=3095367 RepID=UPI003555F569
MRSFNQKFHDLISNEIQRLQKERKRLNNRINKEFFYIDDFEKLAEVEEDIINYQKKLYLLKREMEKERIYARL